MKKRRTKSNMRGSISSYIFVSLALIFIVLGSVYMIQKRRTEAPQSTPAVTNNGYEPAKKSPPPKNTGDAETTPSKTNQNSNQPPANTVPQTGVAIPQTGPVNDLIPMTMLAVLVGLSVAYCRSRNIGET